MGATFLLDEPATWITAGVLLVLAAIVGAGGKFLGHSLPVIGTVPRQVLVGVLGVGLFIYGYQLQNFRITKVLLTVDPQHSATCPVALELTGTIRTAGGDGTVDYRFRRPTASLSPLRGVRFKNRAGRSVRDKVTLTYQRVGPGPLRAFVSLRTYAPDQRESERKRIRIKCKRPPRGYRVYPAEGYFALRPKGWGIRPRDEETAIGFYRTTFTHSNGDGFVTIDWEPRTRHGIEPPRKGYRLRSRRPIRIGGRRVLEWRFTLHGEERVDYIFNAGGDRFAVLAGGGPDLAALVRRAKVIVESIKPR
jgi:hypothetical protein